MKQISEVVEIPFTSSLNMCPEACWRKGRGGRSNAFPLTPTLFPSRSVDFSYKDDGTSILLLGHIYANMQKWVLGRGGHRHM